MLTRSPNLARALKPSFSRGTYDHVAPPLARSHRARVRDPQGFREAQEGLGGLGGLEGGLGGLRGCRGPYGEGFEGFGTC